MLLIAIGGLAFVNFKGAKNSDLIVADKADELVSSAAPGVLGRSYPDCEIPYASIPVQQEIQYLPVISHVSLYDINGDGNNEIIVCDVQRSAVFLYTYNVDHWDEKILCRGVLAPAHCTPIDFDQDGDLDFLIADVGDVFPNDEKVGSVLLYRNNAGTYSRELILDKVGRIADVQAGDFDNDGDYDLAVAEFGNDRGSVFWLENKKEMRFTKHTLLEGNGAIHVPLADYDNDGDLDITVVLSQDEEEVWGLENDGKGNFTKHLIFNSLNYDLGSAGLVASDLDQDGDMDLILPVGDNLERTIRYPQSYHGCYWLENVGGWNFTARRISDLPGCYAASAGDLDHDGDLDVVLVSMSNDWSNPGSASVVALINDGQQNFTTQQIASTPISFITCAIGDVNNDQLNDIICGAFRIQPPYKEIGRVQVWQQLKK